MVVERTTQYLSPEGEARSVPVNPGDLILSIAASVGIARIVGIPACIHDGFVVIDSFENRLNRQFLYHFLEIGIPALARRLGQRGSQLNLNSELVGQLEVPVFALQEQKTIASVLDQFVAAGRVLARVIDAKGRFKRGLMQELLTGKRQFREFCDSQARRETWFGSLPASWRYPRMEEIGTQVSKRAGTASAHAVVLSCSKHAGLVASMEYFGKQVFGSDRSNYKVVRRGQFAYPSNHIEEGSIGLLSDHEIGLVSPIYTVFMTTDEVVPDFLYLMFKTVYYRHLFAASTNASVNRRGSMRWNSFKKLHVPLPSVAEQVRIVQLATLLEDEIRSLQRLRDALDRQRRGVAERLLTGKVRVPA